MLFNAIINNIKVWESKKESLGIMKVWGTLKKKCSHCGLLNINVKEEIHQL